MNSNLRLLAPEIFLSIMAMAFLVLSTVMNAREKRWLAHLTVVSFIGSGFLLAPAFTGETMLLYSNMLIHDGFAVIFKMLFVVVGILTVFVSYDFLITRGIFHGEFFALLLFSTVGMMLVASSYDFMTLFVGLELTSLATYVLVGLAKKDLWSNEAAIKYFLLSIFASAILLFGISIVYAAAGTTNFGEIAARMNDITAQQPTAAIAAFVLLVAGFGFKIAAVPFHMYAPDVYQGAPTPVTIFLAVGPKAAALAGFLRVLVSIAHAMTADWLVLVGALAVLTMTVGNMAAILQTNVKRMLAYSSIAHAGYALIGVAAVADMRGTQGALPSATASVIFYLFAYAIMNIGAFSLLMYMRRGGVFGEELSDFSGLARRRPAVAAAMVIFLLSLAGIPGSIGFWAKVYVFAAAIRAELYWLAIAGVVNVVISLFYYARIIVHMYMRKQEREVSDVKSLPLDLALAVSAASTIILGILPQLLLTAIQQSASFI